MILSDTALSAACHDLLTGRKNLVVWGAHLDFALHEWRRQLPARALIDSHWPWMGCQSFVGLPVIAPSDLKGFSAADTLIVNNFHYNPPLSARMADYAVKMGQTGTFLPPLSLAEIVRHAAGQHPADTPYQPLSEPDRIRVEDGLASLIAGAEDLPVQTPPGNLRDLQSFFGSYTDDAYLGAALRQFTPRPVSKSKHQKACLLINGLHQGGAERQLCNLAVGLKRQGWDAEVLVTTTIGHTDHYQAFLTRHAISCRDIMPPRPEVGADVAAIALERLATAPAAALPILWHLRPEIVQRILVLTEYLKQTRPELLICYLDWSNVIGGVAGILAGVPHILLSGRNVGPQHFPHFFGAFSDSFRLFYRALSAHPSVHLSNNSLAGAEDYAAWINAPAAPIHPVLNCVTEDFTHAIPPAAVRAIRKQLGITAQTPLIVGVFRLSPEKRPQDFIAVVQRLRKTYPDLRAVICGKGAMEDELKALLQQKRLQKTVTLLGSTDQIPAILKAATLVLHTAEVEGSPNVLLEAQGVGAAIVATDGGGTRPCLAPALHRYLCPVGDVAALTNAATTLLASRTKRQKLSAAGRKFVRTHFSVATLTHNTLAAADVTKGKP
jgi:glycosyltransferase involved in cell wall biosynthesis